MIAVSPRPLNSLGDIIRAARSLGVRDESTVHAIARLFGDDLLLPSARIVPQVRQVVGEVGIGIRPTPAGEALPNRPVKSPQGPHDVSSVPPAPSSRAGNTAHLGWADGPALESFPDDTPLDQIERHDSLFRPSWTRSILSGSLSTPIPVGLIDLPALVDSLSRGQVVSRIPSIPRPSLIRGVQILVDRGESMQPFGRDQDEMVSAVRRVVGRGATQVLDFVGCPTRGAGEGAVWDWGPYRPPGHGTPVLILSDLGSGRYAAPGERASVREWLAFADALAHRPCPLIAFVPYPKSRWPRGLSRHLVILQWDRGTSVQNVRRAVGHVLEIHR